MQTIDFKMGKKQIFLLWSVVLALIVLVPLREFIGGSHTQNLSYSEFKQALAAGKVDDVVLKEGVATGRRLQPSPTYGLRPSFDQHQGLSALPG